MHKAQHQDILFCEESKEKLQKHGKASKVRKSKESYTKFLEVWVQTACLVKKMKGKLMNKKSEILGIKKIGEFFC